MKSKQGSFIKRAVLAGVIAGGGILAASAYAVADKAENAPRCEAHGGKGDAAWAAQRAERLATLKQKLALTAAQETAWNAFVTANEARPGTGMGTPMQEDFDTLTAPERLERMEKHAEARRGPHGRAHRGDEGLLRAAHAGAAESVRCGSVAVAPRRARASPPASFLMR